jgi:hypothetical protein
LKAAQQTMIEALVVEALVVEGHGRGVSVAEVDLDACLGGLLAGDVDE